MKSIGKLPIPTSAQCQHNLLLSPCIRQPVPLFSCSYTTISFPRRHKNLVPVCSVLKMSVQSKEESKSESIGLPIMVNTPTGQTGMAVLESAIAAGLHPVPISLGSPRDAGKTIEVGGKEIKVLGTSERETALSSIYEEYPNLIIVDYTVPGVLNENAELYCKAGVPFVMGTTGGDMERLFKTVADSKVYALISPQMGKQVLAFLASLEIAAEQFPGAFSGYTLQVMESHQTSKMDTSGTAKAVISSFQRLGVSFELEQVKKIRDPKTQVEMVGVPEEYLSGHAFHTYRLKSPDGTVTFEFQHNVCGRSIYADGTIDAVLFLARKVRSKADERIYDMIDVLKEGKMR